MYKNLFYNKFFMAQHVSSKVVLIIRRSNCIIQHLVSSHCLGGRPVCRLREDCVYSVYPMSSCLFYILYVFMFILHNPCLRVNSTYSTSSCLFYILHVFVFILHISFLRVYSAYPMSSCLFYILHVFVLILHIPCLRVYSTYSMSSC